MIKMDERTMAYLSFISFEETGGPKTFAASFAPRAHPKNNEGIIKINNARPPGKKN